jgi:glycine dehydrogenase subunit 2
VKLIFEKSQAGRRAGTLPSYDLPPAEVPEELRRGEPPRLPELAEPEIVRHFTALADRTFGVDTGFYPLGSCTMKHNPRVNERVVALPGRKARSSSCGACKRFSRRCAACTRSRSSPPRGRRES